MEKNKLQRSQLLLPRAAQLAQREPKCFMVLSISFDFPSCGNSIYEKISREFQVCKLRSQESQKQCSQIFTFWTPLAPRSEKLRYSLWGKRCFHWKPRKGTSPQCLVWFITNVRILGSCSLQTRVWNEYVWHPLLLSHVSLRYAANSAWRPKLDDEKVPLTTRSDISNLKAEIQKLNPKSKIQI